MREFSLVNANGETYSLTNTMQFFHDPGGLGFEREDTYRAIGDRWVRVNKTLTQTAISGKICFAGESPYDQYYEFLQFVNQEPLKLIYKPSAIEYVKDVFVKKVAKTEIDKYGTLNVEVEFTPLTPWYRELTVITEVNERTDKGVIFPAEWPWRWRSPENNTVIINSDSHMDSPCKLVIYGAIKNPKWTHYANGEFVADGAVTATVPADNHLVVDNTVDPYVMSIQNESNEQVLDVYQSSDFATTRFINLKHGRNSIHVYSDGLEQVVVKAEVKFYYESV